MAWSGPSKEILVLERSVAQRSLLEYVGGRYYLLSLCIYFRFAPLLLNTRRSNKQDKFLGHPPPKMAEGPLPGGYDPFGGTRSMERMKGE